MRGKLSLVDLAGSERGSDTKSHNRQRRTESSEINTSLLALKECIRAIDSSSVHVPYRQSKLTLILKDCFVSKMARTAMIATLSPGSLSTDHTVNTLRYADRIKEKKVGNTFAPSNRSPTRPLGQTTKKTPVPKDSSSHVSASAATSKPRVVDENDDGYVDEFDELDEIMNGNCTSYNKENEQAVMEEEEDDVDDEVEAETQRQLSEVVKELLQVEEKLLDQHMESIQENAELLTEEGGLLNSVQGEDYDVDEYASRLGEILDQKTEMIHSLQDRLGTYRKLLRKEEELVGLR